MESFAVQGYQATSMREIADGAGIKAASIYAHFPSKDDLLGETVKWVLEDFLDYVTNPVLLSHTPIEVLELLVKRHVCYQLEYPARLNAWHVLLEVDSVSHFIPSFASEQVSAERQLYSDVVEALAREAFPEAREVGESTRAIRNLAGRVWWWHSGARTMPHDEVAEFVWSIAHRILSS